MFLLLCLALAGRVQAQPVCDIRHYSFDDGLSQSVVQRIVQSSDGLLWFCTWDGLNSYDGSTFVSYNMASPGGKALSTNRIIDIQLGKDDDLWCQTYDARLFLFDRKERTFVDALAAVEDSLKRPLPVDTYKALPKGVVWVTTRDGLVFRIDGCKFKAGQGGVVRYKTKLRPLKSNRMYAIYEDREGDEWLLTHRGIDVVGRKRVADDGLIFHHVQECAGLLYFVSTSNRLYAYRPQGGFEQLNVSGYSGSIHTLDTLGRDTLVLQTNHSVTFYACKNRTACTFRTTDIGREGVLITGMHIATDRNCWLMLDNDEMVRLNPFTQDVRLYQLPHVPVLHTDKWSRNLLFTDRWGTLWAMPKYGALCYYDDASDAFRPYLFDPDDPASFYAPISRSSLMDKQGNMWLALNLGLEKLSFYPSFFTFHAMETNFDVRAFLTDAAGRLWVGAKSGVVRVRLPGSGRTLYLSPRGELVPQKCAFGSMVYVMLQARDGDIWLGTRENGLFRLHPLDDGRRFSVRQYEADDSEPYSLSSNQIFALHEDTRGHIWVGTYGGGLNLAECSPDGSVRFIHKGNDLKGFPSDVATRVRCLAEAPGDILLVGTTDGLLVCRTSFARPEEAVFCHHRHIAGDAMSLSSNDVMNIFVPRAYKDQVYCLSFSGGLNIVSPDSLFQPHARFTHYTVQDGLISNLVHAMVDDGKGHYWIAAENGLSSLDPLTGQCVNYPCDRFRTGLRFAETVPLAIGDTLLFGTNQGVLELNLSKLPRSTYVPPVLFTEMSVQGRPLAVDVNRMESLVLSRHQRNISFRFTALDFVSPSTIQYAYRLRGLEEHWNNVGNTHSASYMNLPVGEYTLEVRSTNSDGVWMDNVRSLRLVVEPKFSETIWAKMLYIVLFLLLVCLVGYVLFYIYRLRHRIDAEQQLADIKLRFFTDISHELRTPLTLISAPVDEVLRSRSLSEKDRANLSLVRVNTQRMLRMMNQILDFRKFQSHKMKLQVEETDLITLLRQVMTHFHSMAEEKHIDLGFHASVEKLPMWLDVDKVEKVFFNLLSNAFKYTPAGRSVSVEVGLDGTEVCISVMDNGIGIDEEHRKVLFRRFESFAHSDMMHPSSGIGLSLVKEMVDLHHGRIEVESRPGKGSRFTVFLPLDRAVYERDGQAEFILADGDSSPLSGELKPAVEPDGERSTILVVEDNDELRFFLRNILSETYQVLEASNGRQGLDLAVEQVPDMIVTDVMMPVMDGLEMVKCVKADHRVCHIPIVVLSAKSSLDDRIKGLEHGIDDYLAKPFSSAYLKTRIASLLRQRHELQELYMARLQAQPSSETEVSDHPQLEPYDDHFMQQVVEYIEQNMGNADFEIERLAEHLNMCRTVFYRKLKSITGLTPVAFVGEVRLKQALRLMERDEFTISQVAYMTGFKSPKYFSTLFKKAVGCTPSEYREKKQAGGKG